MHKNIHVHLYKITIEYTRTLLYNTVRNKENKDIKERLEERNNNESTKKFYLWYVWQYVTTVQSMYTFLYKK